MAFRGMIFKAVLFDLGGTLIKTASVCEILKRILEVYGIKRSLTEIDSAHREVEDELTIKDYALPAHEFWILWNIKVLKRLGIRENLESLAEAIAEKWWDNADLKLYPEVKETLGGLRKMGFKIGIVTNGFQSDIDEILARTSLTSFFDVTVGVDAVGKPKPRREIFQYALKNMRVFPQEVLFVGDDLKNDYEGAEKAGLKALLIDRKDEMRKKIRKIRDLSEVMRYL